MSWGTLEFNCLGATGSCRLRYGSIRDFILGVQFIDSSGTVLRTGGSVVKNSAGFDLSKFFVTASVNGKAKFIH